MDFSSDGLNCLKCHHRHPDNGNCTAVGGFCTAVPAAYCPLIPELLARAEAAEARADKAEREGDAATTLINYIYYQECDVPNSKIWLKDTIDRWRANKEG